MGKSVLRRAGTGEGAAGISTARGAGRGEGAAGAGAEERGVHPRGERDASPPRRRSARWCAESPARPRGIATTLSPVSPLTLLTSASSMGSLTATTICVLPLSDSGTRHSRLASSGPISLQAPSVMGAMSSSRLPEMVGVRVTSPTAPPIVLVPRPPTAARVAGRGAEVARVGHGLLELVLGQLALGHQVLAHAEVLDASRGARHRHRGLGRRHVQRLQRLRSWSDTRLVAMRPSPTCDAVDAKASGDDGEAGTGVMRAATDGTGAARGSGPAPEA